jgi:RNA polymerase II subunit A small phosphatase-like protein
MNRNLLILDLDETLIYGTEEPRDRSADFRAGHYYVYRRPGVEDFLALCDSLFELAVWSSSTRAYARTVTKNILPPGVWPSFVWTRDRCTLRVDPETREEIWIKDLKKIKRKGYDLDRVIMVDDSPEKLARNYGNLVGVRPYFGDLADNELALLGEYLRMLASTENVRSIEKRNWRREVNS